MKLIECENMEKETVYIPESYLNIGAGRTMTIADNDYFIILERMKRKLSGRVHCRFPDETNSHF